MTGIGTLCLAGGVALNCVATDQIRRLPEVEDLFVPPAASDRGQALGCALYAWHQLTGEFPKRPLASDSFGRALHRRRDRAGPAPRPPIRPRRTSAASFRWRRESDIAADRRPADRRRQDHRLVPERQRTRPPRAGPPQHPRRPPHPATSDALNRRASSTASRSGRSPRPSSPATPQYWFDLDVPSPFMLLAPPVRPERATRSRPWSTSTSTARVQTVDPR